MSGPKEKEESSSNATGAEKRPLRLEELRFPPADLYFALQFYRLPYNTKGCLPENGSFFR